METIAQTGELQFLSNEEIFRRITEKQKSMIRDAMDISPGTRSFRNDIIDAAFSYAEFEEHLQPEICIPEQGFIARGESLIGHGFNQQEVAFLDMSA